MWVGTARGIDVFANGLKTEEYTWDESRRKISSQTVAIEQVDSEATPLP